MPREALSSTKNNITQYPSPDCAEVTIFVQRGVVSVVMTSSVLGVGQTGN